jgi:hypothetical protein
MNSNSTSDIISKDLVIMAFLKTKYWGLFADIESNRGLYTQIRPEDRIFSLMFSDGEEGKYRKNHFNRLFESLSYSQDEIDLLTDMLNEVFPGWRLDNHQREDDLREGARIGHRDLLDLYFAYGIAQNTFVKHMKEVVRVTQRLEKYNEKQLSRVLSEFNQYATKQSCGRKPLTSKTTS